jgi:tetratricopeptide (TPR) repeat protein
VYVFAIFLSSGGGFCFLIFLPGFLCKAANDVRAVQQMRELLVPEMRQTAQQTRSGCKHQVKSDICEAQVEEAMGNYKEALGLYESALHRIRDAEPIEGETPGSSMWKLRVKALRNKAFLEHYMGRHTTAQQILKSLHDDRALLVVEERRKEQERRKRQERQTGEEKERKKGKRVEGCEGGEALKEAELDFARALHELGQGEFWVSQEKEERSKGNEESRLEARDGRHLALDLFQAALQKSAVVLGKKSNHQDFAMSYVAMSTAAIEQRSCGDFTGAPLPDKRLSEIHSKLCKALAIEKIVLSNRHPLIARTLIVKALWLKLLSEELAAIQPDQANEAVLASFIRNEWNDKQLEDWAAREELSSKERALANRLQAASKGDVEITVAGVRSMAGDLAIEALEQARDIQKQVLSDKHPAIAETLFLLSGFQAARQYAKPAGALWSDRWGWDAVLHSSAQALAIMRRLQSAQQLRRRIEERARLCSEASRQWIEKRGAS